MKLLTHNFLTCAIKTCKPSPQSYPLHFRGCELVRAEVAYNPLFIIGVLGRLEWGALREGAGELGFTDLPAEKPHFSIPLSSTKASLPDTSTPPADSDIPEEEEDTNMTTSSPSPFSSPLPPNTNEPTPTPALTQNAAHTPDLPPEQDKLLRRLHEVLLETQVQDGSLVCGNCGHVYQIKEGIANFLLPAHLV
ncbi:MAG: hypothetical protein M1824_001285 [Vezdaea acicularis]|nr:MAG: hypothetical protein M1824_001285 [Vezdaea acicularis]